MEQTEAPKKSGWYTINRNRGVNERSYYDIKKGWDAEDVIGWQEENQVTHEIKISPQDIKDIRYSKHFVLTKDNGSYKWNDFVRLLEVDNGEPTGRGDERRIIFITRDPIGLKEGFVIIGLSVW